ncbi:MAG: hypothetical protein HZA54_04460 [Planctomycetes bacterium]|nr:hypothetical protein [Planctomycetota bacterium]
MNASPPRPPAARADDPDAPAGLAALASGAFSTPAMTGLTLGLVTALFYALPRLALTAVKGGGLAALPWDAPSLFIASAWGGLLPCAAGLLRRDARLGILGFTAGWCLAFHGVYWWNPDAWTFARLQDLTGLAGLSGFSHPFFWLNRIARFSEIPISLALVLLATGFAARAPWWRMFLAVLLSALPLPLFWLLAAGEESYFKIRGEVLVVFTLFLLLGPFACWGAGTWALFGKSLDKPCAPGPRRLS